MQPGRPNGRRRPRPWQPFHLLLVVLLSSIHHPAPTAAFVLPAPSSTKSSRRVLTAAAAAAANLNDDTQQAPIYQGFWQEGLAMLQAAFPSTLEPVLDIPADLAAAECALPGKAAAAAAAAAAATGGGSGSGGTRVEVHAFRVPGTIRRARAAVLSTTPTTLPPQVLNFVIFPDPALDAPIFGADLVQLPGGHLIVLDFQPVAPDSPSSQAFDSRLAALHDKYASVLPNGGALPEAAQPFFSPHFLFARLDTTAEGTATVRTTVGQAYRDYLALYLELLRDAAARGPIQDPSRAAAVKRGHVAYMTYRAENDPARGMLARMFGPEWTERLIHEVLFDWAERGEKRES